MASPIAPRLAGAFQNAKQDFLASLRDPDLFNSVSNIKSIDEVYAFTVQLQNDQSKRQGLRNLSKIKPYLDRLREYAGVIEVFVQVKPDILALIWGPIKLLLQMSDNLTRSFDAIVEAMTGIGNKLPLFEAYTNIFETSDRVLDVLVLFYKDILDFYEIVLNFFSAKRWVIVFDSVWPRYKAKINLVVSSIERHSVLMTEEVTLANITEAHAARVTDMNNWQRNFDFQETQDFNTVYSYISPNLYDDELDKFQRRICERTGKWLQQEQVLKDWMDASNAATRIIRMQGIPGAGKTYIASMIVEKLRQSTKTVLFAFLSYTNSDVKPVSILHSLMFQLAIGDDHFDDLLKRGLRAKISNVFRSSQRNLKSNTRFARETFTELLKCVGTTYIIIDGLDELSKNENMVEILNELLKVQDDCSEVKLFVSSRAQDEIGRTLNKASTKEIRVDEKNRGCIHAYVTVTTDEWLSKAGFDQKDREDIRGLLRPLSTKARGMFLYARIVMANVVDMYTVDMVKNELRVLPENLDEAYSRVLDRLSSLAPSLGTICRRALGWIGCTPVSITVEELSFALSLDPDGKRNLPRSEGVLNVVRLCGPIVEIINGYVNFVHFTVKEYLFERKHAFLNPLELTVEMTKTCLHYLSSNIFDVGIEPEKIDRNVLSGLYRLHWFATTQWIVLLQECDRLLGGGDFPESLLLALRRFAHECENGNFQGTVDLEIQQNFSALEKKDPALHELLVHELYFRHMDVGNWKLEDNNEEDDSWTNLDPFYLSFVAILIHESFEGLLCPKGPHKASCHCTRLKKLYGESLFRCHYTICQPLQMPFASRADRDAHCRDHARLYKCLHPSCDFSIIGFSSASQLEKHKGICHVNAPLKAIQTMRSPGEDEIVPLISDIIAMGMTDELKVLLPRFHLIPNDMLDALVEESAFCGKLEIFQHLWEHRGLRLPFGFGAREDQNFVRECACESIKGDNVEVLEKLAPMIDSSIISGPYLYSLAIYMKCGANLESPRIFEIWKNQAGECLAEIYIWERLIESLTDPDKQERFAASLDESASGGHFSQDQLSMGLKKLALTTCALSIARVLLKHGAIVDFRSKNTRGTELIKTPLLAAAGRTSKDAAELMKLLLLAGADPNASYCPKKGSEPRFVSMEIGARRISKWLGVSWTELVEWTAAERSKNEQPRAPVPLTKNLSH